MNVETISLCRGDGQGYVRLSFSDLQDVSFADLVVTARAVVSGQVIPCDLYWLDAVENMWSSVSNRDAVIVFPLLDGTNLFIDIVDRNDEGKVYFTVEVDPLKSKIRSRLTYKMHPDQAAVIRDISERLISGNPHVEVTGIYPDGKGKVIVRCTATMHGNENESYVVQVLDECAQPLSVTPVVLEDSMCSEGKDTAIKHRRLTYAFAMDMNPRMFCVTVQAENNVLDAASDCMLAPKFQRLLDGSVAELRHASLDPSYDFFFRKHRLNPADARAQKEICGAWKQKPLLSLICVAFNTSEEYFKELLSSVLNQTYTHFELIVVDVSTAGSTTVKNVLARYNDDRIRVVKAENKSIAENTNVGIAVAQGDYIAFIDHDDVIEPDALYWYAHEIRQHPQVDLLYCDEDKLQDGRYVWPVFKPAFNKDLLYSYNYVTHMLMVSRHALKQVDLSEADVSGAQDYDLTLKCVEVARDIRNVSHMLYHWREHPGSTSANAQSKPYAVEAGRLALQRHFDRMNLPAKVESLPAMFRYRVRYEHTDEPKVSIVIPTKDHIDLLRACLTSVIEKTTYRNYEIIIAENNSVEPQTFTYYDELEQRHDNVRVVKWPGKGFNYSAICNYGASFASGEIFLFLNNDTEVIEPEWMTSMVGFFARPDVGMVGAKLLYHDGLVQHGGVWVSPNGCDYINQRCGAAELGYMETLQHPFDCAAITGACQMIRREVFEQINGFDEDLAVVLNDVDLCMKSNATGYLTVFDADALLYHNEFSSRGRDEQNPEKVARAIQEQMRFYDRWAQPLLKNRGKFFNLNLDQYNGHFKIQY